MTLWVTHEGRQSRRLRALPGLAMSQKGGRSPDTSQSKGCRSGGAGRHLIRATGIARFHQRIEAVVCRCARCRAASRPIARYTVDLATPNRSPSSAVVYSPDFNSATKWASCRFQFGLLAPEPALGLPFAIFMPPWS